MNYFADIHCHPTLFPFLLDKGTVWVENKNMLSPSQADFIKLARGNVRLVFVSLYPVEQGFLDLEALEMHRGDVTDFLANLLLEIPEGKVNEIQSAEHDYFFDLMKEYRLLCDHADPVVQEIGKGKNKRTFRYRIAGDFEEVKQILSLDDQLNMTGPDSNTIAVILTIEGGHALGTGEPRTLDATEEELKEKLRTNISKLKLLGPAGQEGRHAPLFITLSHHFWNQLCGHCVSLPGMMNKIFDQNEGINKTVCELGKFVVDELLKKGPGRRILIDTKHMPTEAKKWYYYTYLPQRELATGERIPIISSHSAVNGKETMDKARISGDPSTLHQTADAMYDDSTEFNNWDINLTDEEIGIIHDSGGLIGLNMDKRIIQGKRMLERIKVNPDSAPGTNQYESLWAEPVLMNILHIAEVIYEMKGDVPAIWENITIGSDFDGMISPLWAYSNAESFRTLDRLLFEKLKIHVNTAGFLINKTDDQIRSIVDGIMWGNAIRFLHANFNH